MRGEQKRKIRTANLWKLQEQFTWEYIADKSGTNASYISQIANEAVQAKGKSPRALSDAYAEKIERGLGLEPGWMDQDHRVNEKHGAYNVHPGPDIQGLVPLISWVQAGDWCEAIDHFQPGDAEEWFPCPSKHSSHTYALRVSGDSMTAPFGRSYPDGCLIYVDPEQRGGVVSGDRVIAKVNGDNQVTFKVFVEDGGQRFLRPLNTQYPVITQPFRILGKVIGMYMPE